MTLHQFLLAHKYRANTLTKSRTGHLYVRATINGVNGLFILDTGAGNTVLEITGKDKFSLSGRTSKKTATGAGAGRLAIEITKKCTVCLGKSEYKGIKLALMDLQHVNGALIKTGSQPVDGVIGADIMTAGNGVIDYKKMKLYLK